MVAPYVHLAHTVVPTRFVPATLLLAQARSFSPLLRPVLTARQTASLPVRTFLRLTLLLVFRLLLRKFLENTGRWNVPIVVTTLLWLLLRRPFFALGLFLHFTISRRLLKAIQSTPTLLKTNFGHRLRTRKKVCTRLFSPVTNGALIRVETRVHNLLVTTFQPTIFLGMVVHRHRTRPPLQTTL